jgi:hypothetical protein|tara:strand:- start:81 stop:1274 length:1194 start_codon:yes stop_codon:yes gene_type:complete
MTPLVPLSLFGIALLIPVFSGTDDDNDITVGDESSEPVDTVEPVDPSEPLDPIIETPEEPIVSATATLDDSTSIVTVTTNPEETGTIYTVANRVDFLNGESNFNYETAVILVPQGVDLGEEFEAGKLNGGSAFYNEFLLNLGATQLGSFTLDPAAAEGVEGALPNFIYPEGTNTEFLQIYSVNFGDGAQIETIVDVEGERNLTDSIDGYVTDFTTDLVEGNGGANITTPTEFDGSLAILETTIDYIFEGDLVRTDVSVAVLSVDVGTDFTTSAITLAEAVTQTPTDAGTNVVTDGTLTELELFTDVPGTEFQGSYGVSVVEYDTDGNVVGGRVDGGLGVSTDANIERFALRVTAAVTPGNGGSEFWNTSSFSGVVTSFGNVENTPAGTGAVESSTSF